MVFDIRQHVDLDPKGRAGCPACIQVKGPGYKAKNLSVDLSSGAYKCHRGCTPQEIRAALGETGDRTVPKALVKDTPKPTLLTPAQVNQAHDRLLKSTNCLNWLLERGIPLEAIKHYKLGAARAKAGAGHLPSIAIPIPTDDRTHYYQKKRIAPWLDGNETARNGAPKWSQYGIPQMVYFTHKPEQATETWLCEGEWDSIRLGWEMRNNPKIAVACFTCGAGNVPPDSELAKLPGIITLFYDLDDPGKKGALKVQERMKDRTRIAIVPSIEDPKTGYDVSDSLQDGFTLEDFTVASSKATAYAPPKKENPLKARLITNDELLSRAQDYTEWLVPDILTADELFVLGMPPRGGKSLFCLTLAKAVASGGTFLDRPVTQGSVIYVNLEDSETKVKQRQMAQGWSEELPVYWLDKFKLSELDYLKEIADDYPDLRLIILDTLSRIRDDGQEESSSKLAVILEPLQEFAKERGICILISHHMGKQNIDKPNLDPFDLLRGSSAIRQTARGAIVILAGEQSYRLIAENGFSDRLDISVRLKSETLEWSLLGNWQPRVDGDMKAQILDHLNLIGQATVAEIASALNFKASSVSTIMARLQRDGLVLKQGGKGRQPGIYSRSLNLLKQLETQFEQPNPDTARDTDLLKQENLSGYEPEKVINAPESDQKSDHFSENAPRDTQVFEQSQNPDPVSVPCSNSPTPQFEQVDFMPIGAIVRVPSGMEMEVIGYADGKVKVFSRDCGEDVYPPRMLTLVRFPVECRFRYVGKSASMERVCKMKHLQVLSVEGEYAEVSHSDWYVTQSIPLSDLKLVKR